MLQWVLYGAAGNRLVATDIDASLCAIETPWATKQLVFVAKPARLLESMVKAAPHCSTSGRADW